MRHRCNNIFLTLVVLFFSLYMANGQTGSSTIRFQVRGLSDSSVLVVNYYGNGTFIKDTLKADKSGNLIWEASALQAGIYMLVLPGKKILEFIAGQEPEFQLITTLKDPMGDMKVKDSPENELFYQYHQTNTTYHNRVIEVQKMLKKVEGNIDSVTFYKQRIDALNKELISFKLGLMKDHPQSFVTMFLKAIRDPEIPEAPVLPNGRKDSSFAHRYFLNHYWDDISLDDDRILRTPVFHNKLKTFFEQVVYQQPDSIIRRVDILLTKSRPSKEMFKYILWYTTYTYEISEIMGMDKVFVHIIDTYYNPGKVDWIKPKTFTDLKNKARKIKPVLIGAVPPNLIMLDTTNKPMSVLGVKARYTIVLFWDPDCGHCKEEIPVLHTRYDSLKSAFDVEVFAICADTTLNKCREYIQKKNLPWINVYGMMSYSGDYHQLWNIATTPVVFLLDEKKQILTKHLSLEQTIRYIRNREKKTGKSD
ncbi:MAG: DUF5106 domain-containing protein [Bacteroidetes bacterium]|nr:DUF5106 domain-containing protein [Bacteroidota bacterium]